MRFLLAFILILISVKARVQLDDFLDNCDWCKKKARYREPLDIGEWMIKCQKKPKPLWFNMKYLGRVYGTYKKSISSDWLYSKKLGWVYNMPNNEGYFYTEKWQWIYIKEDMIYFFKTKKWDYLININS